MGITDLKGDLRQRDLVILMYLSNMLGLREAVPLGGAINVLEPNETPCFFTVPATWITGNTRSPSS